MMLNDANENVVEDKDVLNYQVLKYDRDKQKLQPAADARTMIDRTGDERCLLLGLS